MPGDERVRAWVRAPGPYVVVDQQTEGAVGVSLRLMPLGSPIPTSLPRQSVVVRPDRAQLAELVESRKVRVSRSG